MIPYSRPKRSPRVNCLKSIPFTAAHTYIDNIWQYPPPSPQGESVTWKVNSPCFKSSCAYYNSLNSCKYWQIYLELNSIERLYRSSGKEKESRCLASRSPQNVKLSRLRHSRSDAKKCTKKCDVRAELLLCLSILCFHSRGQHLCKFIITKESVYVKKRVQLPLD